MSRIALKALLLVPLALAAGSEAATDCLTSDSQSGKCVPGTQCPQINRIRDNTVLRKYKCGNSADSQELCCPLRYIGKDSQLTAGAPGSGETAILESNSEDGVKSQPLRSIVFDLADTDCWLPNIKRGKCVPRVHCPQINRIRNPTVLETYICSRAGNGRKVCCPLRSAEDFKSTSKSPTEGASASEEKSILEGNCEATGTSTYLRAPIPPLMTGTCGRTNAVSRVAGGRNATEGDWPWQVLVLQENALGLFEFTCGGSLISHKHVLSAAHCFRTKEEEDIPANSIKLRLGEHDRSKKSTHTVERAASRVRLHGNFTTSSYENDIALILMAEDVVFNRYVSPICLPYSKEAVRDNLTGKVACVTGWGPLRHRWQTSNILKEADLSIWDSGRCWDVYEANHIYVKRELFICAGDEDGQRDACEGDSGGPLVLLGGRAPLRYHQIGIVSFGMDCAMKGYPGVYARVTSYLGWINENL